MPEAVRLQLSAPPTGASKPWRALTLRWEEWRAQEPRKRQACREVRPRGAVDIEVRKIVVLEGRMRPESHVRQDTAYFSSLHPQNLSASRSDLQQGHRSLKNPEQC